MQVAAISYMCDQNEPSEPFLLELDCPETPTKEELAAALVAAYREVCNPELDEGILSSIANGPWGLQVGDDPYLIIGLPDQLQELRTQFP